MNPANPAIGALDRSFSADPAVVAVMAEAEIRGLHEHGVRATVKHFPGLGSASANTDFDDVDVTKTWTDAELDPYRALFAAGMPDAVMSGHIVNDTIDPGVPASLSPATIDGLLRAQLGWAGVVVTDDLGAEAIAGRYERDEAIALALEAGNDLLLFANQTNYVAESGRRGRRQHRRSRRVRTDQRGPDRPVDRAAGPPGPRQRRRVNMTLPGRNRATVRPCAPRAWSRSCCCSSRAAS